MKIEKEKLRYMIMGALRIAADDSGSYDEHAEIQAANFLEVIGFTEWLEKTAKNLSENNP